MKSYIAHVSSRRLFRALNIESNLARPVIIQIPTQSPGRYLRPTPGQSDEPSDLRGSLSPTSVYSTWQSPIQLWTGRDVA